MSINGNPVTSNVEGYDPLDDDGEVLASQFPANYLLDSQPLHHSLPELARHTPASDEDVFVSSEDAVTRWDPIAVNTSANQPLITRTVSNRSHQNTRRSSIASLKQINTFTKKYIIPAAKWAYSPLSFSRKASRVDEGLEEGYVIEYSVFKPLSNPASISSLGDFTDLFISILSELDTDETSYGIIVNPTLFSRLIEKVDSVIKQIPPRRISQGSSGSYFIYSSNEEIIGVFKPKDEEPYGPLSPKWTKWLHRTFFPCFFGRSCLIPNLGYISEAAASLLDQQLLTFIIPHTEVVSLSSKSFYYSLWYHKLNTKKMKEDSLPKKIGSFQVFLKGYIDAQTWFRLHPLPWGGRTPETSNITIPLDEEDPTKLKFIWSLQSIQQFREELEKLVILDYLMRNTDRGLDNWMIKVKWKEVERNSQSKVMAPVLMIGAIDSGLAFPWKHPDEWRSFPYGWLFLPMSIIGQPFSTKTRLHFLPLLTSTVWWEQTVSKLKGVFMLDKDFKERMWSKQLAVIKGQAFNIVEVLKFAHLGPLE